MSNSARGCSYFFGPEAVSSFLERNYLSTVIRAHEVQLNGYKIYRYVDYYATPQIVTVFSAPNYCDTYGNQGAIIKLAVGWF